MRKFIIAAALLGATIATAHAEDFHCRTPVVGKCVCTETVNPASVLGYNATSDKQSVPVNVVCIDAAMNVTYPSNVVRKEDGLGGSYNSIPVPRSEGYDLDPVSDPWRSK